MDTDRNSSHFGGCLPGHPPGQTPPLHHTPSTPPRYTPVYTTLPVYTTPPCEQNDRRQAVGN